LAWPAVALGIVEETAPAWRSLLDLSGHGPREDDPDITIVAAANQFAAAFPGDVQSSISALTNILDDLFQLRDYVGPTCYQALTVGEGAPAATLGNIRSTLEGREGFVMPLADRVRLAVTALEKALKAVQGTGGIGSTAYVTPRIDLVYLALENIRNSLLSAFPGAPPTSAPRITPTVVPRTTTTPTALAYAAPSAVPTMVPQAAISYQPAVSAQAPAAKAPSRLLGLGMFEIAMLGVGAAVVLLIVLRRR